MQPDYYQILGISHIADLQEIKQATHTKINDIKTAFAVLSQTKTRTVYDAKTNLGPYNHYATLLIKKLTPTADIKAAAQARLNHLKEAYETLSKPETRAAYDFQWPATKSPRPQPPLIPLPPKRENIIVEQKPRPPSDRNKSPAPPSSSPPISLTNAARHTTAMELATCVKHTVSPNRTRRKDRNSTEMELPTGMELANSGTRLRAVIVDAFTVGVPIIFWSFFNSLTFQRLVSGEITDIWVKLTVLMIISVLLTNLVLLYHYGQTLGKRMLSIKVVEADGSRAGVSRIIGEFWWLKLFNPRKNLAKPRDNGFWWGEVLDGMRQLVIGCTNFIGLITISCVTVFFAPRATVKAIVDGLQESSDSTLADTIEVRVFPGYNDAPYRSPAGVRVSSTLMVVIFGLVAWEMITAHTDYVKRGKVLEAIQLLEGLKEPAKQYMVAKGEFPPLIGFLTNNTSGKYTAILVSNPKEFYLEATMSWKDSVLAGKTVRLIYHPGTKTWSYSANHPDGIPLKYLPSVYESPATTVVAATTPADTDDLNSNYVLEAIQLLEALIKPAEQYLATKGEFPPTIDVLTKNTAGKYTANLVSNPQQSYFEAILKQENTVLAGKTVRLIYLHDTKSWSYSATHPNGIPLTYLPSVYQLPVATVLKAPAPPVTPSRPVVPPPTVPKAPLSMPERLIFKCVLRKGRC